MSSSLFRRTAVFFIVLLASFYVAAKDSLPSGYRKIKLGMTVEEVKTALKADYQFGYRGERDVSMREY